MGRPTHPGAAAAAVLVVFVALAWPALSIWWAGANGSLGDLSEIHLLMVGGLVALGPAIGAGVAMNRAVTLADRDPAVGHLDPWAALAAGVAVLAAVLTPLPALALLLLLPDEGSAIGRRVHLVTVVWIVGAVAAAAVALAAGRWILRRGSRRMAREAR